MHRDGDPGVTAVVDVVVTYLELDMATDATAWHAVPLPDLRREPPDSAPTMAAVMYRAVGGPWHWTDRLTWTESEWNEAVNRPDVELWIARIGGDVAGYFELHVEARGVELKYFGLMPEFTGRRIGGAFLAAAIDRARQLGKARMTVNTCTLDHPAALPNYLKRGFTVVKTEPSHRTVSA